MAQEQTRRERQREATYDEIIRASRESLASTGELSLRAVAGLMGMTPPALYRYVANYQDLVDLVAYEIDKAATETFRTAAATQPADDAAGQLVCSTAQFRRWALANPREFGLVFANPIAEAGCVRREMLTLSSSGHLFTDQVHALWQQNHFPVPAPAELPESVREAVRDPLIPAEVEGIAPEDRGLVWVYMQAWTQLYGVVALEVFGHMDPRVIQSGEMFIDTFRNFAPRLGLADDWPRLEQLIRSRLAE